MENLSRRKLSLPLTIRSMVYSFLDILFQLETIIKLSKKERDEVFSDRKD